MMIIIKIVVKNIKINEMRSILILLMIFISETKSIYINNC
jgi:hypothetical protein